MKYIIPMSLLLGFIAGYSVNTMFNSKPTDLEVDDITMSDSLNDESVTYDYKKNDLIEEKLDVILSQLNDLSINIENNQISQADINNRENETRFIETSNVKIELTEKEIDETKDEVYNALLDTNFTLPELLNSEQLNNLPAEAKQQVLDEVARRIDSGEIDKAAFLPGYKASVN